MKDRKILGSFDEFLSYCVVFDLRIVKMRIDRADDGLFPGENCWSLTAYDRVEKRIVECRLKMNGIYGVSLRAEKEAISDRLLLIGLTVVEGSWNEDCIEQVLERSYDILKGGQS